MAPVGSVGQTNIPNNINTDPTQQTNQTTGSGAIGQNGAVPPTDPSAPGAGGSPMYAAMMGSLMEMMPQMSNDQQEIVLAEVTAKLKDMEDKADKDQVGVESDKKKAALAEKEQKLGEASKKLEKAIWDRDHQSIWDKIKGIFMAIVSALVAVLAAIATVVTLGAASPLLAVAVVGCAICVAASVVMAVDQIVQTATGLGIAGNLDKLAHPHDPASWAKADMGFGIALMVVGLAASIPGMLDGSGEAQLAGLAEKLAQIVGASAKTATRMVDVAENIAAFGSKVGEKLGLAAKTAGRSEDLIADTLGISEKAVTNAGNWAKVAETTLQIGGAVGDATMSVVSGTYAYDATNEQAGAKTLQGAAKDKQALMQQLDDFIDIALSHLMKSADRFNQILDGIVDTMKAHGETLQHAAQSLTRS